MNQAYLLLHKILCLNRSLVGLLAFFILVPIRGRQEEKNIISSKFGRTHQFCELAGFLQHPLCLNQMTVVVLQAKQGSHKCVIGLQVALEKRCVYNLKYAKVWNGTFLVIEMTCNRVLFFFIVSTPSTMGRGVRSTGALSLFNLCRTFYFKSVG